MKNAEKMLVSKFTSFFLVAAIINISRHLALNSCIVTEEANVEDSMETDSCESSSDSDSELEEYSDEDNKNILPPTELPSSVVTGTY